MAATPLVVITDSNLPTSGGEEEIFAAAGITVRREACVTEADVVAVAADADALLVQWAPITADVIDQLERCRMISRFGIGVDMIDLDAATRRGIAVANTPHYCLEEVSAHALALMLALADREPVNADHAAGRDVPDRVRVVVGHEQELRRHVNLMQRWPSWDEGCGRRIIGVRPMNSGQLRRRRHGGRAERGNQGCSCGASATAVDAFGKDEVGQQETAPTGEGGGGARRHFGRLANPLLPYFAYS